MPNKEEFIIGLARGLAVLKCFTASQPEMTISQVAAATGLNPAVARRCLLTLVHLGYVRQDANKFLLRATVLEFGAAYAESLGLRDAVQPALEELRGATGDSASFNVLDGDEILQVLHLPTRRLVREVFNSGGRLPAYLVPTGRVLLADLTAAELTQYLERITIERRTSRTLTTIDELAAEIDRVRRDGYSIVVDEIEYGLVGIAVPVFDVFGKAIAGVGSALVSNGGALEDIIASRLPELRRAAAEIGTQLQALPTLARSLPGA